MSGASLRLEQQDNSSMGDNSNNDAAPGGTTYLGLGAVLAVAAYVTGSLLGYPLWGALGFIAIVGILGILGVLGSRGTAKMDDVAAKRRRRSIAVAWGLVAVMAMFYVGTFVQFGGR